MTSNVIVDKCPQCGAKMKQQGMEGQMLRYHCPSCGYNSIVTVSTEDSKAEYYAKKAELLARVRRGVVDWKTTSWEYLHKDLLDFMGNYDEARLDINLNMGLIACITHGFQSISKETYKECKHIFKMTEKAYKILARNLKEKSVPKDRDRAEEYEHDRKLYKKCRNDYRNTQLAWKIVFSLFKGLVMK